MVVTMMVIYCDDKYMTKSTIVATILLNTSVGFYWNLNFCFSAYSEMSTTLG